MTKAEQKKMSRSTVQIQSCLVCRTKNALPFFHTLIITSEMNI